MVADSLEEDATTKQGYLEGLDINIDTEFVPGVGTKAVGNEGCEQPVEVEEEEERQDATHEQLYEKDPEAI
jgi:hypothetical protein